MRKLLTIAPLLIASTASAYAPGDIERVEGALSRLALERGAFVACAEDSTLKDHLTGSWISELKSVGETLKQHALPEDFVASLPVRFNLDSIAPAFASDDERGRFCAMLGDWQRRWELFYVPSPVSEIEKVLEQ